MFSSLCVAVTTDTITAPGGSTVITPDWELGDVWSNTHSGADVPDYLVDVLGTDGEPIYGSTDTDPPLLANLMFGKITNETPGNVTITFYKGDPIGSHATAPINVDCICI